MAGYRKNDHKGDERWTIRIPDGHPADPPPEQIENSAEFPEIGSEALAAFMGQFQTAEELEEFFLGIFRGPRKRTTGRRRDRP